MSAPSVKSTHTRTTAALYWKLGVPDDRSPHARAEERLAAVLAANPGLAPDGWCDRPGAIADAVQARARPDVRIRPDLVRAFAWCRAFLALACRRVAADGWNATAANLMAFEAEKAGKALNGHSPPVEQGTAIAAALSLGIEIARYGRGSGTHIGACVVREGRR